MEIVLTGRSSGLGGRDRRGAAGTGAARSRRRRRTAAPVRHAARARSRGGQGDRHRHPPASASPRPTAAPARDEVQDELRERRAEIARLEERISSGGVARRRLTSWSAERGARGPRRDLERGRGAEAAKRDQLRELERVAGLSAGAGPSSCCCASWRRSAPRGARDGPPGRGGGPARRRAPLAQHPGHRDAAVSAGHAAETTVSVVAVALGRLKGRIIGREGRNIRALETITGSTSSSTTRRPCAVGFDPVRREIAKLTLEKLIQDGRIHPARIEEAFYQAQVGDRQPHRRGASRPCSRRTCAAPPRAGEAPRPAEVPHELRPERPRPLDRGPRLAAMMAEELGAARKTARRAALLHDIGKAVSHEVDGPHALVGGELARRYNEPEAVAHAMEAHHNEVELQTVEAVIVQAADALSGARPGPAASRSSTTSSGSRTWREFAARRAGVEKVYAMQAGREIRVIVAGGGQRRRGGDALARHRAGHRAVRWNTRADQDHGDPREPRDRLRALTRRAARCPLAGVEPNRRGEDVVLEHRVEGARCPVLAP